MKPHGHARRTIMLVVRLVAVPIALVVGWHLVRSRGLELRPVGGAHLAVLALLLNQCAIVLIGCRMSVGLRLFGIDLRLRDALRIATQSQFYFFFVPISASNEVSRYLKIKAIRPQTELHTLVVALVLDRLMGLFACLLLAIAAWPFIRIDADAAIRVPPFWIIGAVIALGALGTAVAWKLGWLARVVEAWRATRGRRRLLVPATLLVLLMQAATILSVWFAAKWLGLEIGVAALAFGISIGTLGQLVPITFAGAGPAEVAGAAIFIALGHTAPEAGVLAALIYLTRLMAAVEGGLWESFDGLRSLRRPREISA